MGEGRGARGEGGSVLGMALGGAVATQLGWRASFGAMACLGFALVVCFRRAVSHVAWAVVMCGGGAGRSGHAA